MSPKNFYNNMGIEMVQNFNTVNTINLGSAVTVCLPAFWVGPDDVRDWDRYPSPPAVINSALAPLSVRCEYCRMLRHLDTLNCPHCGAPG